MSKTNLGVLALLLTASLALTRSQGQLASDAGTIYYVSAAGNDATGTPNDPTKPYRSPLGAGAGAYAHIPADITRGTGDHVIQFMDSATYGQLNMTPKITDATHRIILRAAAGTAPTMDADSTADGSLGSGGTNNLTLRVLPNNVVVTGLRFTNTNVDTDAAINSEVMVRLEGSNCVFDGNFFDGSGRNPGLVRGGEATDIGVLVCRSAANDTFSNNRWDNLGAKSQLHITATCTGGGAPRALDRSQQRLLTLLPVTADRHRRSPQLRRSQR
jgi:hypothetical protein